MSAVLTESPDKAMNSNRWEHMRLGDICQTTSGGTPSRKRSDYFHGNIPWVKSGELPDGLVGNIEECINEEALKESSAKLFPAGTLLIALYGATVGKLGILTRPAATNQAVCAIFPPASLDTRFLFWHLKFRRDDLVAQAVGGAQPNISQAVIRSLVVPVPPLDRQHEIVAEIEKQFSRLDEAVANLKRVKANLKRYKPAAPKAAVEGRLAPTEAELARHDGRSYETGAQLLQRILETRRSQWKGKGKYKEPGAPDTTDLPELPEGWAWATLDLIGQEGRPIIYGIIKPGPHIEDGVPYVRVTEMKDGYVDVENLRRTSPERAAKFSRATLAGGDLLISKDGTIGKVAVVPPELAGGNITQHVMRAPIHEAMSKGYVVWAIRSETCQRWLTGETKGVALRGVNVEDFRRLPIPVPPLSEQQRVLDEADRRVSLVREVGAEVDANLKRAERFRKSTLLNAFLTPAGRSVI